MELSNACRVLFLMLFKMDAFIEIEIAKKLNLKISSAYPVCKDLLYELENAKKLRNVSQRRYMEIALIACLSFICIHLKELVNKNQEIV